MDIATIDKIIDRYKADASSLIMVLLEIQSENRWLPKEAMMRVSERLNVPLSKIQHIATFYKVFSVVPKGRHEVHVCMGPGCHVHGADRVLETMEQLTGIKAGETDSELKFSLETVNCLGCCAIGPVVEIDGNTHGKLAVTEADGLLKSYD